MRGRLNRATRRLNTCATDSGSSGRPSGSVNTRSCSFFHPAPTAKRCSACCPLRALRTATVPGSRSNCAASSVGLRLGEAKASVSRTRTADDEELLSHLDPALVEVDVTPPESTDFAAPHSCQGGDTEQGSERLVGRLVEECSEVGRSPPGHLRRFHRFCSRRLRLLGDVALHGSVIDSVLQGLVNDDVDVTYAPRTESSGSLPAPRLQEARVELVQILWRQGVKTAAAESVGLINHVIAVPAVAIDRRGPKTRGRQASEPLRQVLLHRDLCRGDVGPLASFPPDLVERLLCQFLCCEPAPMGHPPATVRLNPRIDYKPPGSRRLVFPG